jgi:polyisoprenyl-teichoic acid--peptidoglycan teichoic acid transferase
MDSVLLEQEPSSRTQRRRARTRRRVAGRAGIFVLAAALVGGGIAYLGAREPAPRANIIGDAGDGGQLTTLVAMTLADDPSQQADSLTLFGIDRTGDGPVVLLIPVGTFGQIPGQGFEKVGKALTFGRPALQETTVENLIGITIDRTVVVDDVSLATVVNAIGGIDVDVQEDLYDTDDMGRRVQAFGKGRQHMSGATALAYMTVRGEGVTELSRFVRMQKVWQGLFAAAGPGGVELETAVRALDAESIDADDALALATVLKTFATRDPQFEVLPADEVGTGGDEAYKIDDDETATIVTRDFAGSVAPGIVPGERPRLEIRNGNGVPESGERVAARLVPAGMKIVVTGNAKSFDFASTRVVVYGDDAASLALGRKIVQLLGVGEVEVGTRGQTVVDVTIVVGKDLVQRS